MASAHRRAQLPLVAAATAVLAWGVAPVLVREVHAPTSTIVLWRLLLALPIAVGVAYATGGRITWSLLRRSALTGLCFALSLITAFASYQETSIANATLIPALQPALILLLAARLFGERRTLAEVMWAIVAFAGVTVVVLGADSGDASLLGDLLAVANLLVFTGYFLLAKRARVGDVHSWSFLACVFIIASLVVTPWSVAVDGTVGALHGTDWVYVLALVLVPGMIGHGFMTWAHHYVDVSVTSMLTLANPVVSIVLAWIVFAEALNLTQMLGTVVVLVALASVMRHQRAPRLAAAEASLAHDLLDQVAVDDDAAPPRELDR